MNKTNKCAWVKTFESCVDTSCGHVFNNWPFSAIRKCDENYSGDERFIFCPFCGKIILAKYDEQNETN